MDMSELNKFLDCKNAFESAQQKIGGEAKEIYLEYFKAGMQHQQAKVEELQVQLKGAEERAQLILQYKDKYRLERDELQKQLIDQGQRFNEQAQRVKDLEHKVKCEREISLFADKLCCELQRKIDAVKDLMEMLEQDDSVFLIYEELEKALKGEG
ncbi:MAG: hypothetical protein AB1706_03855 [Pseudomonadota bacterium]